MWDAFMAWVGQHWPEILIVGIGLAITFSWIGAILSEQEDAPLVVSEQDKTDLLTWAREQSDPIDAGDFAEFYCDLCNKSGISYTREQAFALYQIWQDNPELAERRTADNPA